MHRHTHRCSFVPPHVLARVARAEASGIIKSSGAQRSAVVSDEIRRNRRSTTVTTDPNPLAVAGIATIAGIHTPKVGSADIIIYDDHNQWTFDVDPVRGEDDPAVGDPADVAYNSLKTVRDFYEKVLGRDSIDNAGLIINGNVNYGTGYDNAFWDGQRMVFGNGDNSVFRDLTGDIDVPGHELTHGVTQYTAGLNYTNDQAGALNESFSDMMGSAIDAWSQNNDDPAKHNWLIGEDIMAASLVGEALRSMSEPGTAFDNPVMGKDPQPRDMSGYVDADPHMMSGITNRWFYLVCTELGSITKGALLMYQTLQKLWPTANFSDTAHVASAQAALLAHAGQLPGNAAQIVRGAARQQGFW